MTHTQGNAHCSLPSKTCHYSQPMTYIILELATVGPWPFLWWAPLQTEPLRNPTDCFSVINTSNRTPRIKIRTAWFIQLVQANHSPLISQRCRCCTVSTLSAETVPARAMLWLSSALMWSFWTVGHIFVLGAIALSACTTWEICTRNSLGSVLYLPFLSLPIMIC